MDQQLLPQTADRIARLKAHGYNMSEIAELTGVSRSRIERYLASERAVAQVAEYQTYRPELPPCPHRQLLSHAAQFSIILREMGRLKNYTNADLRNACMVFESRFGAQPRLSSELRREIKIRAGQMFVLDQLGVPMPASTFI